MKTNNIFICLLLAFGWLCQSCNIATTVHFNKDYSGDYAMVLDLSDLISMAGMFDTTGTMDQDMMIQQMRDSIEALHLDDSFKGMSGVSDGKVDVSDEGVITIAFKFDNVESLNASCNSLMQNMGGMAGESDMPSTEFMGDQQFIREGKTVSYSMTSEAGAGEGLLGEEGSDMDMFTSMMDFTIDLSFDRKVKSVDVDGLTIIEKGDNIVKTRVDFAKFLKEGKYSIKVKTK